MSSTAASENFQAIMLCTVILYFKYLAVLFIQGSKKFKSGSRAPEDIAPSVIQTNQPQTFGLTPADPQSEEYKQAKAEEIRWQRILGNDMECIPFGVIMAWVSLWMGNPMITSITFGIFTAARITHTVAFAKGIFIPRTLAWQLSIVCTIVMAINGLVGAFSK
jgi:uncharacterized membrane protein YecN with MAPEG domain